VYGMLSVTVLNSPKEFSVLHQEFIIAPFEINNHKQKIKLESVYHFMMAIEQSSFPYRNKITPLLNSALRHSHWLVRRNPPERSSPMVTVGILGILILFGIGLLLLPNKSSEKKKSTLIDAEGPVESVDPKKVGEILPPRMGKDT